MATEKSLRESLPHGGVKKISEIAGKKLGRFVSPQSAGYAINYHPNRHPSVSEEVRQACIAAALEVIEEEKERLAELAKQQKELEDRVAHTMALTPVS